MTTTAPVITFKTLRADLADALETGDDFRADAIVDQLYRSAAAAVAERDTRAIVDLRAQAGRLARRTARVADGELAGAVTGRLEALDRFLDHGETAARMSRADAERADADATLADAIVPLLRERPRRPRELAEHFRCDPSQVSRALRGLVAAGRAARVDPPAGVGDRRAHWFGAQV